MYSTTSVSLEGADSIYASTYINEGAFNLSISAVGHHLTLNSISTENLQKIADVINRALATNGDTSSLDALLEGIN